ncbi:MAG: hypothetical protein WC612_05995 [Bdellovibrionales bacterium]|jgi:hypothetical protein
MKKLSEPLENIIEAYTKATDAHTKVVFLRQLKTEYAPTSLGKGVGRILKGQSYHPERIWSQRDQTLVELTTKEALLIWDYGIANSAVDFLRAFLGNTEYSRTDRLSAAKAVLNETTHCLSTKAPFVNSLRLFRVVALKVPEALDEGWTLKIARGVLALPTEESLEKGQYTLELVLTKRPQDAPIVLDYVESIPLSDGLYRYSREIIIDAVTNVCPDLLKTERPPRPYMATATIQRQDVG